MQQSMVRGKPFHGLIKKSVEKNANQHWLYNIQEFDGSTR